MASDGRIMRFSHSPISVYIADPLVTEKLQYAYIADVEYAMEQWTRCSEGKLQFEQTESADADIRIYWEKGLPRLGDDPLGEAKLIRFDSGDFHVEMSILLHEKASLRESIHRELRVVLLHELGHAIGLWGHSKDRYDIMYLRSNATQPTRRDKNTLLKLLSTKPNSAFHENAIAEIRSDISREPNSAYLHFWLGTVYADKDRDNLAIMEFLTALKLSPDLLRAANRLGRIFQEEGMYESAITYYSKEMEQQPSSGIYGLIGWLYFQQEKYDKAVDHFEKALSMDESFVEAKKNLLASYHLWSSQLIKGTKVDDAIEILFSALKKFPESRVIRYDLGTAYDTKGQYEGAIEQYKEAIKLDPSFVAAKGNIASCMSNLGARQMREHDWEGSIDFCNKALQWDSDCWAAQKNLELSTFGLGRAKHEMGSLDEAMTCYRAVLEMNPQNLDAYSSLGYTFFEKGTYDDAIEQFQAALSIDPDFQDAKEGLAAVRRKINLRRAGIAAMLAAISTIVCLSVIFVLRHRHRKGILSDGMQSV